MLKVVFQMYMTFVDETKLCVGPYRLCAAFAFDRNGIKFILSFTSVSIPTTFFRFSSNLDSIKGTLTVGLEN